MFNRKSDWMILAISILLLMNFKCGHAQTVETRDHIRVRLTESSGGPRHFGTSMYLRKSSSGNLQLYAGAPSYGNLRRERIHPGALFACDVSNFASRDLTCNNRISLGKNGSIGMSMAKHGNQASVTVCGPQYTFDCPKSTLVRRNTGICYTLDDSNRAQKLAGPWPERCGGSITLDLMFVLDESGSVGSTSFQKALNWINNVLEGFRNDINKGNITVGLIKFGSSASYSIRLQKQSFAELQADVSSLDYGSAGNTYTDKGIDLAKNKLISDGRSHVPKLMIVITDGASNSNRKTVQAANAARAEKIIIVAVGVGSYIANELEQIADDKGKVLTVNSFDRLDNILKSLQQVIEESAGTVLEGAVSNSTNELLQSQAGFSTHSSLNGLYLGAVGAYDRMGAIMEYRISGGVAPQSYTDLLDDTELQMIMKANHTSALRDSYVGYSVTSGRFLNGFVEHVASGLPRYQSRGAVIVYRPFVRLEPSTTLPALHPPSAWWQIGAYFGQSVLGIDLNRDALDDLIVSAPLYSDESGYDQGRVFVFMNNPLNPGPQGWLSSTFQPLLLRGSSAIGARFGYSLASVGDLDQNRYNDVIVGAPLEEKTESDSGCIYVYYNSKDGLSDLRKQKILGKSIRSRLIQFGGSVASGNEHGIDVDDNGYPDIVASAPSSDTIVILRSRPVVAIKRNLTLLPSEIDLLECARLSTSNCTSVQVCLSGTYQGGTGGRNSFTMDFTFNVDTLIGSPSDRRLKFEASKASSLTIKSVTITNNPKCFRYNLQLQVDRLGSLGTGGGGLEIPPRVIFSYDFPPKHKNILLSAMLDPVTDNSLTADWTFKTGCSGANQSCSHDLEVTAAYSISSSNEYHVLKNNPGLFSVHVQIRNLGPDFSYFTKVNVTSGSLARSQVLGNCVVLSESDSSSVHTVLEFSNSTYAFKDLMLSGQTCNFTIQYNLQSLTDRAKEPEIFINGAIYSNAGSQKVAVDENQSNNRFSYRRQVRYAASLLIGGTSSPDAVVYKRYETSNSTSTLTSPDLGGNLTTVQHVHEIKNLGPLMIAEAAMRVIWPAQAKHSVFPLFYLYQFSCKPASTCQCNLNKEVNAFGLSLDEKEPGKTTSLRIPDETEVQLPQNLICSDVTCHSISCVIANMSKFAEVKVSASFKVWLPSLTQPELVTRMFSEVMIDTSVGQTHSNPVEYSNLIVTSVSEFKQPEVVNPGGPLDIGAIIGGIIGGLVLLCLVVFMMWKCGFFESKYGEMTRAARGGDDTDRIVANDDNDMAQ